MNDYQKRLLQQYGALDCQALQQKLDELRAQRQAIENHPNSVWSNDLEYQSLELAEQIEDIEYLQSARQRVAQIGGRVEEYLPEMNSYSRRWQQARSEHWSSTYQPHLQTINENIYKWLRSTRSEDEIKAHVRQIRQRVREATDPKAKAALGAEHSLWDCGLQHCLKKRKEYGGDLLDYLRWYFN